MVYGVILAGGVGKRTGLKIPKQYIEILNKPVIIYTLEAFLSFKQIDEIYIAIAKEWTEKVNEMIEKFIKPEDRKRITLVEGGKERVDTIINVEKYIIENKTITDDDIILMSASDEPDCYILQHPIYLKNHQGLSRKINNILQGEIKWKNLF